MTIALGILGKDSIVVAADTEETHGNGFKVGQGKVLAAMLDYLRKGDRSAGALVTTGAGSAGYLDALQQSLCDRFLRDEPKDIDGARDVLQTGVSVFYQQHVIPFAILPEHERPLCELIIGAAVNGAPQLLTTDKTTIRQCQFTAVGMGAPYATLLLSRLWRRGLSLEASTLLAAYVLHEVKQSVSGCGKDSHIVVIRTSENAALTLPAAQCELLEHEFAARRDREDVAIGYMLGIGTRPPMAGITGAGQAELRKRLIQILGESPADDRHRPGIGASLWSYDRAERRRRLRRRASAKQPD